MTRMVFCKKYQKEMAGLDYPPYPGAKGISIFNSISKEAWQEWQKQQTMLINEKHLNLRDLNSRAYLEEQMERFFANEPYAQAEGYVPPSP